MEKAPSNCMLERDMDRLIAAHDGDVALLYLYLRRHGGNLDSAARELCRTGSEIAAAAEKLHRLGLCSDEPPERGGEKKILPPEELPEYTAEDIVRRSETDSRFQAVVAETQRVLGRGLSSADMKTLFGIYDYLALPPEVILELLNFCVDRFREKYGPGRLPSMRAIEKEAYVWANSELLTLEQAEEYIEESKKRRQTVALVKTALGIRGRELTATEQRYIGDWLDLGFGVEELEAAYDRTVTNTGALKWQYMDKIIKSWDEKGLHTLNEIAEKDAPPRRAPLPSSTVKKSNADNLAALKNKLRSLDKE